MKRELNRNPYFLMGVGFYAVFALTKDLDSMPEFLKGVFMGLSLTGYLLYFFSMDCRLTRMRQWKKDKLCFWKKR